MSDTGQISREEADRERRKLELFSKAAVMSWGINWVVPFVILLVIFFFFV